MRRIGVPAVCLVILTASIAMADEPVPVTLSDRIGVEIDRLERDAYGLFPDITGFRTARIFRTSPDRYRVDYTFDDGRDIENSSRKITVEVFEHTRLHVQMVEAYMDTRERAGENIEALVLYQMALRYSIEHQYDMTVSLLEELQQNYPARFDSLGGAGLIDDARQLAGAKAVLSKPESLIDVSGRTRVYVFSGFYGLWLSIAIPAALEANSSEAYALSLLTIPAASILVASAVMSGRNVTRADASMISAGGWLGTWQGLGWASLGESDGNAVVGFGVAGGLAGIATAGIINRSTTLTTGHADLIGSGMWWGAWFGALVAMFADMEDGDDALRSMLIGSDVAVLAAGLGAKNTTLSRRRVRFMNLGGILGGVAGGGVLLLLQPDDIQTVAGVFGVTTIAGAWIALHSSREPASIDTSRQASSRPDKWNLRPSVELRLVGRGRDVQRTPHFGLTASF
jgi:hypothetical protein